MSAVAGRTFRQFKTWTFGGLCSRHVPASRIVGLIVTRAFNEHGYITKSNDASLKPKAQPKAKITEARWRERDLANEKYVAEDEEQLRLRWPAEEDAPAARSSIEEVTP